MKLALGSAQFGMHYGVTNAAGKTPQAEVRRILRAAADRGVDLIDTAPAYGDAEAALGAALAVGSAFRIVTKTPTFGGGTVSSSDAVLLEQSFQRSLDRLNVTRIYALLIHDADDLLAPGGERLLAVALDLRSRGLVEKVGVSVYDGEQIDAVMARFPVDIVQLPLSVLDQRLVASGHLKALKRAGVELHARSLFLQGLMLAAPESLPAHLAALRTPLEQFHAWIRLHDSKPVQGAIAFAALHPEIDVALIGVENVAQLEEACQWCDANLPADALPRFAVSDRTLVDPRKWSQLAEAARCTTG